MTYTVQAGRTLNAEIQLPASKSISNRALILNAMAGASTPENVHNLAQCDDTDVLVKALSFETSSFDIGAAGTSMRFLTAFLAGREGSWEITGSERMQERPIQLLVDALRQLGADIAYLGKEGFPPLKIHGKKLKGGELTIDGSISSQYLSALMMAGPSMENGLKLTLEGELVSKPYFLMTMELMRLWGVSVEWDGQTVDIRPQTYKPIEFTVESDWSAASYWYEMLTLAEEGTVLLKGLEKQSLQGDARVVEWFSQLGVQSEFTPQGVRLTKIKPTVTKFEADLTDQPDLAQTLALTCVLNAIPFRLTGLQSLKIKETDRLKALVEETAKLGFTLTVEQDSILEWKGEVCTMYAVPIETYDDHRMAMAFAPAALAYGIVLIDHPEVVSKSYPDFWEHLKLAAFHIPD